MIKLNGFLSGWSSYEKVKHRLIIHVCAFILEHLLEFKRFSFIFTWKMHIFEFVDVIKIQSKQFELSFLSNHHEEIICVRDECSTNLHWLVRRTYFYPMKRLSAINTEEQYEVFESRKWNVWPFYIESWHGSIRVGILFLLLIERIKHEFAIIQTE